MQDRDYSIPESPRYYLVAINLVASSLSDSVVTDPQLD
jgi:hypothetical protein